MSVYELFEHPS